MIHFLISLLGGISSRQALIEMIPCFLVFGLCLLGMGLAGRIFLGKRSNLNHAVSSSMAVIFLYVTTIALYVFHPWNLSQYLSPLPFVTLAGDQLALFPFRGTSLVLICTQILPLLVLCFLVNLIDSLMPQGEKVISWFLFRLLTVVLSMGLHLLADWAFRRFLPQGVIAYAPVILMVTLVLFFLMGLLSLILGLFLSAVNPILGAACTFFFSSILGKQLTKALLTTALLCVLFGLVEFLGFDYIDISQASLLGYLPAAGLTLLLWFLLGRVL